MNGIVHTMAATQAHTASTLADPAFRSIPKTSTAFLIWRIENLALAAVPKDQFGSFFSGDSYVVLSASEYGDASGASMLIKETKKGLEYHIHFWLGESTTNDEAGVAAYKAVELDDYFGGTAVQHREVQGNESKRFLAYFKNGVKILNGGAASGFHHVTDEIHERLFIVKGKRAPIIKELPGISWQYMNDGDAFVLDLQHAIFVWTGKYANRGEKLKAANVAQGLKDDRDRPICFVEDGDEAQMTQAEKQYFGLHLPLQAKEVKSHKDIPADDAADKKRIELKLYRCSDEDGTLKVTEVKSGPLFQEDLSPQDSFIVDNGELGIWVWVGKKANQKERVEAMRNAQGFAKKKGYSNTTPVTRVIDNGEPMEFKALFRSWKDRNQTVGLGKANTRGSIAKVTRTKFDASTLHDNHRLAAELQMVDDGSGTKEVFRCDEFELVPVESSKHGKFFSGDCYVVVYGYQAGGSQNYIIYYWMGNKSTTDEQGTAALKTVELDNKYGGKAVQIRVIEGKEPPHFLAMFGGKLITYSGGHASGFQNLHEVDTVHDKSYLLQIRGTPHGHVRAMEVEKRAASLNSNDVFLLYAPSGCYIWAGKGSTGDEREMAKQIANMTNNDPTVVSEGQEKADFWEGIGGQEPYSSDKRLQEEDKDHTPRLFVCSNATGNLKVEEIMDFNQSDLIDDDVMLLDTWNYIFVWIGDDSNVDEKKLAEEAALEYLRTDTSGRDPKTPIVRIKQGYEPPTFTGHFGAWDRSLWSNNKTYEQLKQEIKDNHPGLSLINSASNGLKDEIFPNFPLGELRNKDVDKLPEGVNPSCKERYLSDEDFQAAFQMSKDNFHNLSQWRQVELKKKAGLF